MLMVMIGRSRRCVALWAALGLLVSLVAAAAPVAASPLKVESRLVAETASIRPGEPFWIALHQRIAPGWHTYWRNPGDSGEPVTLEWTLPSGVVVDDIAWPVPERLPVGPVMSFGFSREVLLPMRVTPPADLRPGDRVELRAQASWLVCADICIPEESPVSLALPVMAETPAPDPQWGPAVSAVRHALPQPSPWPASFSFTRDTVTLTVAAPGLSRDRITDVAFFPYEWGPIAHAGAQERQVTPSGLVLTMPRGPLPDAVTRPIEGVLLVTERLDGGPSRQALVVRAEPTLGNGVTWSAVASAVGLAMLGGLILNLMPCVLPLLSVKALSLMAHAAGTPAVRRRHGLAYTAGVLLAFGVVGGVLLALRAAGEQIGWGFHLQSPAFVTLLAYVLFAMALSLSGVVVIGGGLATLSGGVAARSGYRGSFLAGLLATVVATPCTAPFMAGALGYAVTQPAPVAFAVFEALGLGLALPYLLLSVVPGWTRLVPRPGRWMLILERVLAWPLYATVAWLVWVLSRQTGPLALAACLAGLVLIAFAAWLYEATRHATSVRRVVSRGLTAASVVLAVALTQLMPGAAARTDPAERVRGERYTTARLVELRAQGTPVFVNVTAAWCITCLVNERLVLRAPAVTDGFARKGVIHLTADWTNRDPEISQMLASFDRNGVPLYLLYPGSGRGVSERPTVLPQILTERVVLDSLDRL